MKRKIILLTGASGFLGSQVKERLTKEFQEYVLISTSRHGDDSRNILKLDLTDYNALTGFFSSAQPDIIYHLGSVVDLNRDFVTAKECFAHNLMGTTNLLEVIKTLPIERFVYASTEEVYGTDDLPYREDDKTEPPSPYAVSKLASENMCRIYSNEYNLPVVIFRIGTMYGPNQPSHRFIVQSIHKALLNQPIPLNSGAKKRDYVYISDVVDALMASINLQSIRKFEIINIGGGVSLTLKELIEKIIALTGSTSTLQIGAIPDRISEADTWLLDNSKAKRLLGWEPATDIHTGLEHTIRFYTKTA